MLISLNIFTDNFTFLKNKINPIYALNIKDNLLGKIDEDIFTLSPSLGGKITYVNSKGNFGYYIYLLASISLLKLSSVNKTIVDKAKKSSLKRNNLFSLEISKIIGNFTFKVNLIGSLLFVFILFLAFYSEDKDLLDKYKRGYFADYYKVRLAQEVGNYELNTGKVYKYKYDRSSDKNKDSKEKDDETTQDDDFYNSWDTGELERYEKLYNNALKGNDYYLNKKGKEYYQIKLDEIAENRQNYSLSLQDRSYNECSYEESKELYKHLTENNNLPVLIKDLLFMSSFEKLSPLSFKYNKDNIYSHSSSYLPRRLERTYPIDFIIVSLISIISLGAYSYDKEYGNQVELLYTQPIQRKYHLYKVLASTFVGLLTLIIIFMFLFLLGLTSEGLGDINFPVVQYLKNIDPEKLQFQSEPYFKLIPIWIYDLRLLVSYIFQIGFLASFAALISAFVKEKGKVVFYTLALSGLIIFIQGLIKNPLKIFSPFTHLRASELANGSLIVKSGLKTNNIMISLLVLFIWTIIFTILGSFVVNRKEVK